MSVALQQVRIPLLIRVVLTELAERRGQSEEQVLEDLIRDAVRQELLLSGGPRVGISPSPEVSRA